MPTARLWNFVTITRRDDGTLRPNFRPAKIGTDFDYETYADAVACELRQALQDLVGKKVTRRKRSSTQGR